MSTAGAARSERGFVAGADTVLIGTVLVLGLLLLATRAWAVADRHDRLEDAAAEYLRTYTEADDPTSAGRDAETAARSALGSALSVVTAITGPDPATFGPCALARVTLRSEVPGLQLPFGATFGAVPLEIGHGELIDAHRAMTTGARYRAEDTPCAD